MKYSQAIISVVGAMSVALVSAGTATAKAAPRSEFMTLGQAARAPMGFRHLCARNPDVCAIRRPAGPTGPLSADRAFSALSATGGFSGFSLLALDRSLRDDDDAGDRVFTSALSPTASLDARPAVLTAVADVEQTAAWVEPPRAARIDFDKPSRKLLQAVNRRVNVTVRPRSDAQLVGRAEFWSLPVAVGDRLYGDCEDYALQKRADLIAAGIPAAALSLAVVHTRQGLIHAVLVVATDKGDLVLDNRTPRILSWNKTGYRWVMRQVSGDSMNWAQVDSLAKAA
jgi:predicted transglutaminase-like cysteine proteinase